MEKRELRAIIAREALAIENGIAADTITLKELIKRRHVLNAAIDKLVLREI